MESEDVIANSRDHERVVLPGTVARCDRRHHIVIPYDVDERVSLIWTAISAAVDEGDGVLLPCDCRERRSWRQRPS